MVLGIGLKERMNNKRRELPVTVEFNKDKVIGRLTLFDNAPEIPLNYTFAIGGIIKPRGIKKFYNKKTKKWEAHIVDYELREISLISDKNYKSFLDSPTAQIEYSPPPKGAKTYEEMYPEKNKPSKSPKPDPDIAK